MDACEGDLSNNTILTWYHNPDATLHCHPSPTEACEHEACAGTVISEYPKDTPGIYGLHYQCNDNNGNVVTRCRTFTTEDMTIPILKLIGDEEVDLQARNCTTREECGQYEDPGATCVDGVDGTIRDWNMSVVNGPIYLGQDGTWRLKYTCSDSRGHEAVPVYRNVTVSGADCLVPVLHFAIALTDTSTADFTPSNEDSLRAAVADAINEISLESNVIATDIITGISDSVFSTGVNGPAVRIGLSVKMSSQREMELVADEILEAADKMSGSASNGAHECYRIAGYTCSLLNPNTPCEAAPGSSLDSGICYNQVHAHGMGPAVGGQPQMCPAGTLRCDSHGKLVHANGEAEIVGQAFTPTCSHCAGSSWPCDSDNDDSCVSKVNGECPSGSTELSACDGSVGTSFFDLVSQKSLTAQGPDSNINPLDVSAIHGEADVNTVARMHWRTDFDVTCTAMAEEWFDIEREASFPYTDDPPFTCQAKNVGDSLQTLKISSTTNFNSETTGTYFYTYFVADALGRWNYEELACGNDNSSHSLPRRTVIVRDTLAPVITVHAYDDSERRLSSVESKTNDLMHMTGSRLSTCAVAFAGTGIFMVGLIMMVSRKKILGRQPRQLTGKAFVPLPGI